MIAYTLNILQDGKNLYFYSDMPLSTCDVSIWVGGCVCVRKSQFTELRAGVPEQFFVLFCLFFYNIFVKFGIYCTSGKLDKSSFLSKNIPPHGLNDQEI